MQLTGVSSLSLGIHVALVAGLGVHGDVLLGDKTILDQLAHVLTAVGIGNFRLLVGVKPDLLGAAAQDGGGESVGETGHHHQISDLTTVN